MQLGRDPVDIYGDFRRVVGKRSIPAESGVVKEKWISYGCTGTWFNLCLQEFGPNIPKDRKVVFLFSCENG